MIPNLPVLIASSFIPFLLAYAWYHPKVFGGETWTKVAGMTKEQTDNPVKPLHLILSIFLNFLIAFGVFNLTVHAFAVSSLVGGDTELLKIGTGAAFMAEYGHRHLTFGHGVVHGIQATILFAIPVIGYVAIFERKSIKYFFVTVGFWMISLILMAGVLNQWGVTKVI